LYGVIFVNTLLWVNNFITYFQLINEMTSYIYIEY